MRTSEHHLVTEWRKMGPTAWAEHRTGWIMPDGKPIKLLSWQRAVLDAWWKHRRTTTTLAISNVKKTGKTTLNAILLTWRWLALPGEHFACANDLDQSTGRQFSMAARMVKRSPVLSQYVTSTRTRLVFWPTDSILEALPVDAVGNAGANHLTCSHTEAWGILYERGVRAYEELTPQPGEFHGGFPALRVVDSYAGHLAESDTWHGLVDRGLAGKRLDRNGTIFQAGGLLLFHMSGEAAQERCFRGTEAQRRRYYRDQQAELRPGTFRRLHKNERASAEDAFVAPEQWDALVLDAYSCPGPNPELDLTVGLDIGVKHDYTAAVSVFRQEGSLWLGPYMIHRHTSEREVDLGSVVQWLRTLNWNYGAVRIVAEPWQAAHVLQRLRHSRIQAEEFLQSQSRLTEAGNALFTAIREGRLVVYQGAGELRQHVLNASAKETPWGIRMVKGTGKIDAAIALAMAVCVAGQPQERSPLSIVRYT